jgi:hypothetical protein
MNNPQCTGTNRRERQMMSPCNYMPVLVEAECCRLY